MTTRNLPKLLKLKPTINIELTRLYKECSSTSVCISESRSKSSKEQQYHYNALWRGQYHYNALVKKEYEIYCPVVSFDLRYESGTLLLMVHFGRYSS